MKKSQNSPLVLPRGVLRVKKGYNPNSSSIGTVLYSFPLAFVALSTILGVLAALVRRKGARNI
jgi:hypothetical protein